MNESLIRKGINGINQVAESIAGAEYWNKVAPGMKQLQQEAGERIAKAGKAVAKNFDEENLTTASNKVAKALRGAQGQSTTGEEFEEYAKKIAEKIKSGVSIDDLFKQNEAVFNGKDWSKAAQNAKNALHSTGQATISPEDAYKQAGILTKLVETPKAYFTNPDKDIRKARITTAAVGYAGLAVGGRYLSGGTLTRDSYGRNDIAGVPFI